MVLFAPINQRFQMMRASVIFVFCNVFFLSRNCTNPEKRSKIMSCFFEGETRTILGRLLTGGKSIYDMPIDIYVLASTVSDSFSKLILKKRNSVTGYTKVVVVVDIDSCQKKSER